MMLHFIRTKDKKVNYLFVHLNLCIALALGLVVFISGIETAVNNEVISHIDDILLLLQMLNVYEWIICLACL